LREAAFPVAEIDRKAGAATIRDEDVKITILVYVGDADNVRMRANGQMDGAKWS
jgi:hypothetical protein